MAARGGRNSHRELLVQAGEHLGIRLPVVEHKAGAESQILAIAEGKGAAVLGPALFEVRNAERIRGDKPIVAGVPPRRVPQILGVIEDGNGDHVAIDGGPVGDPLRTLAPHVNATHAFTVDSARRLPWEPSDSFASSEADHCIVRVAAKRLIGVSHDQGGKGSLC